MKYILCGFNYHHDADHIINRPDKGGSVRLPLYHAVTVGFGRRERLPYGGGCDTKKAIKMQAVPKGIACKKFIEKQQKSIKTS